MPISGGHMAAWTPMAEAILADFEGRLAGRFLSVLRNDTGNGLQVVDVRMNAPPGFYLDAKTRNDLARLIDRFQQAWRGFHIASRSTSPRWGPTIST